MVLEGVYETEPTAPLQGYKQLARVAPLLERLHDCDADKAGNRTLHYDRYIALVLLYLFNPILTSLRGLAEVTSLDKVAQATGGPRISLSALVAHVQADVAYEVAEERSLTAADRVAGVVRDVVLKRLGSSHHNDWHQGQTLRLVVVEPPKPRAGEATMLYLVTDQRDWSAELAALAYRYRWSVELFFRWPKSMLGCRHLLRQSAQGVAIQVHCALIASVLLQSWAGAKPNKRVFEMFCLFFAGWVSEPELLDFLDREHQKARDREKKTAPTPPDTCCAGHY